MIPKIIHYCWFGEKELPDNLKRCISSWSKFMPEYEIMRWDESNFNVNELVWTQQAYEMKKYAFVSDYVRLWALYHYGGIYLDTDVMLIKSLAPLSKYNAFTGFENEEKLTSAVIGSIPKNELIKEYMEFYIGKEFISNDGVCNLEPNVVMMTDICVKYGLKINNKEQEIKGMHIFPKSFFCPLDFYMNKDFTEDTLAIHYFNASWLDEDEKKQIVKERKRYYKFFNFIKGKLKKILINLK